MKITVDSVDILTLDDVQKNILKDNIPSEIFESDIRNRVIWVFNHPYKRCFSALKAEWDPKLEALGVQSIPTDPDEYAELVFSQPTYKDRSTREAEGQV